MKMDKLPASFPVLSDVDLRHLRVFDAVARNKGFAAAQDELNVSQATISIQISQLEQRLGMRLCERGRGGFHLTEHGVLVHEATHDLFRSVENFRGLVASARGRLQGELRFGTVDAMATNAQAPLDRALGRFCAEAPDIVLQVDLAAPQSLHQGVVEGRYHVVLTPTQRFSSAMRAVKVFRERQSLYCGRRHPLYRLHPKRVAPAALTGAAYVARSYMHDWQPPLDIGFGTRAVASHMESIAILILSGRYLGYLPTHYAERWVEKGDMRPLLEQEASYFDQFFLVCRKAERNRAVKLLFDGMIESFAATED
jgi:DNA-binding transcriptional LysR family regulator